MTYHLILFFSVQKALSVFYCPPLALHFASPIFQYVKSFQKFPDEAELCVLSFPPIQ